MHIGHSVTQLIFSFNTLVSAILRIIPKANKAKQIFVYLEKWHQSRLCIWDPRGTWGTEVTCHRPRWQCRFTIIYFQILAGVTPRIFIDWGGEYLSQIPSCASHNHTSAIRQCLRFAEYVVDDVVMLPVNIASDHKLNIHQANQHRHN